MGLILSIRAYSWARSELETVKKSLPDSGVTTRAQPPEGIAPRGQRGVDWALRREKPTCLERALVLQAWLAAAGPAPDVIIGVRAGEAATEAHAWVDGSDPWYDPSYEEITRLMF
ncbi:MAG: lasso peptide biosynthesis B2 protein [Pseudomonadales bacterium]